MIATYALFRSHGLTALQAFVGLRMLARHDAAGDPALVEWMAAGLRSWSPAQLRSWLSN